MISARASFPARENESKRATRAASTSEEFSVVLCRKTTTSNYHIWCFDDNLGTQHKYLILYI